MHSECPNQLSDIQDCPIFEPTKEEFTDPIDYITKIRPIGEKTGIVKIRPPSDWKPPFCRHPEQFLFSPRIQCLKEVEGVNRMKLNFTDNFIHFWDLHGQKIIKPIVGGQPLDLYKFFDLVNKEGGYNLTCTRKLWSGIGRQLGLNSDVQWSSVLKDKYRKLLYPFEYFIKLRCLLYRGEKLNDCFYSSPRGKIRPLFPVYIQYEEVMCYAVESKSNKSAPDLGPIVPASADNSGTIPSRSGQGRDIMCQACNKGDEEHVLLICESCEAGFHTFCLYPALESVPPGDWRCPGCIHRLYTPSSSFGFEHSKQTYTLSTFSHLANLFKRNYFDQPIDEVPYSLVEREFWCLLASPETPVEVQYGADLHSSQHGSGFPCSPSDCYPSEEHYIESGWNLNNIAYLEGCVLKHVPGDISGLKKPWLYVGMCFSTFCWHVEDHWNHSINYLHHGEPKSWYGVPPYAAEKFEACFRKYVPGLFVNDPQLLHHLITMIPPTVLMDSGVPVFRTHQKVGEFVVTFPRAYHAGYNQGFNFAEAVNFATKDWFHLGRECVQIYKEIQKSPIFSHNELVCRCFACPKTPGSFSPSLLADIRKMVTVELENRNRVFQTTMDHAQMNFELLPERERNCRVCKEMLFLSAVVCDSCKINRFCLDHIEEPCPCDGSSRVFQYRYSGQDLLSILENVNKRSEEYKEWLGQVEAVVSSREQKRALGDVEELYERGKSLNFDSYSPGELELVINRAKLVSKRAQQILSRRSRAKRSGNSLWLYELEELQQLADELDCLPCTVPQSQSILEKFLEADTMLQSIRQLLESNCLIVGQLAESLSQIQQLQVHSPLCDQLSDRLKTAAWMQQYMAIYDRCQEDGSYKPQLQEVQTILSMSQELPVTCEQVQAGVVWLHEAISQAKQWQDISSTALNGENKRSLQILQEIYEENAKLMIAVPVPCELTKAIQDAQTWSQNYSTLSCSPSLSQVQVLVEEASILPVYLPDVAALNRINSEAENWIHRLSEMFLLEDTETDLIFSLLPKGAASQDPTTITQTCQSIMDCLNSRSRHSYQQEAQLLKTLWKQEVSAIREIRKTNMAILHTASAPYPPLDKITCVTCDKCASEQMIFCNLCLSLQHGPCAGLSLSNIEVTQNTFVCTKCVRTNRPLLSEAKAILATWSLELNCSYTRVLEILIERGERWEEKSTRMLDSFRQVEMEIDYPEGSTPPQTDQSPLHLAQHYKSIEEHLVEGLSIELTLEHTSSCVELWREAYRQSRKGRERGRKGIRHSSKPALYHPRKHRMIEKKEADASADRWSDSSEDTCAALNCTCVQEENVDWIQCDVCEAWFHFICVRLTRSEVNTMDDYTCPTCSLVEPK